MFSNGSDERMMNLTEYMKTQIEPSVYTRHQETAVRYQVTVELSNCEYRVEYLRFVSLRFSMRHQNHLYYYHIMTIVHIHIHMTTEVVTNGATTLSRMNFSGCIGHVVECSLMRVV